jgi:predicted PurR-regulated permease PerM
MSKKVDISHRTIIFIAAFLLGGWILYHVLDLILLIFVALILMSSLSPVVGFLTNKFRIPKAIGLFLVYILVLIVIGGLLTFSLSPLVEQTSKLAVTLPGLINNLLNVNNIDTGLVQSQFSDVSKNLLGYTVAFFSNIVTAAFVLVLTFYLSLEREKLEERVATLFVGREAHVKRLLVEIEEKLGAWFRGQLILSVIIGFSVYLGLTLLQIPYALPLAIIAGAFEVVPMIGPILAAAPAVLLALSIGPIVAVGVAAMYFVIQQLENHIIVPQIMNKAVGLNPLAVILAIAVGGRLFGIAGALLAVPITVVLQIVISDIIEHRQDN